MFLRAPTAMVPRGRLLQRAFAATAVDSAALQKATSAHARHVFPDSLAQALDGCDRHGRPTLHGASLEKAPAILKNPKNQRYLWQEAAALNCTGQHAVVVDVLYAQLYANKKRRYAVLPRTTSLFLQQVLVAAVATSAPVVAVDVLQQLAQLDTSLLPLDVRSLAVDAVLRLLLVSAPDLIVDVVSLLGPLHVKLDKPLATAVVDALFAGDHYTALVALVATLPPSLELPVMAHVQALVARLRLGQTVADVNAYFLRDVGPLADDVLSFLLVHACKHRDYDLVADVLGWLDQPLPPQQALALFHTLLVPAGVDLTAAPSAPMPDRCVVELFEAYPAALPSTTSALSLAVSAASFFQQPEVAAAVFDFAAAQNVPILDVAYGHAGATAAPGHRQRFSARYNADHRAGIVATAQQWNAADAGYHFSGALLQFMCARDAPALVQLLLREMQYYSVEASEADMAAVLRCLTHRSPPVLRLQELYDAFPRVIKNAPAALTQGLATLLQVRPGGTAARADLDEALALWRCFVWTEAVRLEPSVFALLVYVALRDGAPSSIVHEVSTQYTQQAAGWHASQLHSAVLELCASCRDLDTMTALLRQRPVEMPPLGDADVALMFATVGVHAMPYLRALPRGVVPWSSPVLLSKALMAALAANTPMDVLEVMGMAIDNDIALSAEACAACVAVLAKDDLDPSFKTDLHLSTTTLWAATDDPTITRLLDGLT
ncbi:hypothetical protein ACHHYP_03728 [Achlya hypogyna]|uniref:Uncharacterized protein n=1 Tax=Achlya hypogyna TaxID=1202772 RepID=A0A1V9Z306_ACHHY|nr:hypothetical protein ACHHYP_03728 [Achlya hypogyna]